MYTELHSLLFDKIHAKYVCLISVASFDQVVCSDWFRTTVVKTGFNFFCIKMVFEKNIVKSRQG